MNMDIGLPNGLHPLTLQAIRVLSVFFSDYGATAHVTYEKHLLRNIVKDEKGTWII